MIVKTGIQNTEVIGDVTQNSVTIDPKNIQHIIQILSSNLYSNPVRSFLREIVSNAYDSHIEAKSKEPIVITITDNTVAIRDFGTGISPQDFKNIYLCIGSSTKRESNDYLGYFGIGRFSALACSDIVNITDFYGGKKYCYVMLKDTNSLRIDSLGVYDTDEQNGLEVKIPVTSPNEYINELKTLSFFNNVYVHGYSRNFNDRNITSYKTFKVCSYAGKDNPTILLGNVLYELNLSYFKCSYPANVYDSISIISDIGNIDVTPNREQLIYSKKTVEYVQSLINDVEKELDSILEESSKYNYTSVIELYETVRYSGRLKLGDNEVHLYYGTRTRENVTYKGITCRISEISNVLNYILGQEMPIVFNPYFVKRKIPLKRLLETKTLRLPSKTPVNSKYLKRYLKEEYGNYTVILSLSVHKLKEKARQLHKDLGPVSGNVKQVIKKVIKEIIEKIPVVDVYGSNGFEAFKKQMQSEKTAISSPLNITVCSFDRYVTTLDHKITTPEQLEKLTRHKRVLWCFKNCEEKNEVERLFSAMHNENTILIKIAKTALSSFKMPDSWIPFDEFVLKDFKLWKAMSFSHVFKDRAFYRTSSLLRYLPKRYKEMFNEINTAYAFGCYRDGIFYKRILKCRGIYKEALDIGERLTAFEERIKDIKSVVNIIGYNSITAYFGMKKKLFRINYETYKQVKEL